MKKKLKLVVLSGAGISAESGLGTFRDSGGLWDNYKIEDVATPEAWKKDTRRVLDFYNIRRKINNEASCNLAHHIIANLEEILDVTIVTQNIDNLHERAGSSTVIHLHGEITKSKSSGPKQESVYYDIKGDELNIGDLCPDGYQLRPHVVWFGEEVPLLDKAASIIAEADLFLVIGTSLLVYPAAGLIHVVSLSCKCFAIDPNKIPIPSNFTHITSNATDGILEFESYVRNFNREA